MRALGRNHSLWSALVRDLSLAENRLPDSLKTQLIELGLWAMRYSTLALLQDISLAPLLEVNRNIVGGLLSQPTVPVAQISQSLAAPIAI